MSHVQPTQCCVPIMRFKALGHEQRAVLFHAKCGFGDQRECGLHYAKAYGRSLPGGPRTIVRSPGAERQKVVPLRENYTPPASKREPGADPIDTAKTALGWDHAAWVLNH